MVPLLFYTGYHLLPRYTLHHYCILRASTRAPLRILRSRGSLSLYTVVFVPTSFKDPVSTPYFVFYTALRGCLYIIFCSRSTQQKIIYRHEFRLRRNYTHTRVLYIEFFSLNFFLCKIGKIPSSMSVLTRSKKRNWWVPCNWKYKIMLFRLIYVQFSDVFNTISIFFDQKRSLWKNWLINKF